MASRRQRRKIGEKKKRRKARAATIKKKIVKKPSAPAPQAIQPKPSAARTGCRNGRQEGTAPAKEQDDKKHDERRRSEKRTCGVCGVGRLHDNDHFCPYNYIHGPIRLSTCAERCRPGSHPLLLASSCSETDQLRRLVRVTNVPLSAIPGNRELNWLFRRFGALVGCKLTRLSFDDRVGFGWVAFESRDNAEEAVNKLNGHLVGDRRLRVDWAYPC
ncbi:uncharacterized protein [Triticum aestivum]|nr:uncharacterized protein LOC123125197 [Triticum aestivum]